MICFDCGRPIGNARYILNSDVLCQECFSKRPSKIMSLGVGFNTTRDKLYEFPYEFKGKVYDIRTKGQWNRFMKKNNLHDDIKQSPRQPSEFKKQDYKPIPAKEHAELINRNLQELGIRHKVMPAIRKVLGRR